MSKYYDDARYNAVFDRCVDVMTRLIQKYGHQVLEEEDVQTMTEHQGEEKQSIIDKAA
ncbi:hypothetical protein [[Clostridium] scindens]|uniref:hypothetical protein n=1 Tax=Clostridium scindens (strain JCM 10418 / VPI 12708) TaxID=29347 RepID=UPI0022E48E71|nr:hypothetical protein [[Clostridium] scindens]